MAKRLDLEKMRNRLRAALADRKVYRLVFNDLAETFTALELEHRARWDTQFIMDSLAKSKRLQNTERLLHEHFERLEAKGRKVSAILDEKMKDRASIIYGQVKEFFAPEGEDIVDLGCGDGQVTDLIYRNITKRITGYDVRHYPAAGIIAPIERYDGEFIPGSLGYFDAGLMTNVAHHEADNAKLLKMLAHAIRPGGRLVVIETVPISDDPAEFERTFVNDYVYNRLFHDADVPVPGTYETEEGWVKRFAEVGFELEDLGPETRNPLPLGYDQPTIKDWHTRMVFRYNGKE